MPKRALLTAGWRNLILLNFAVPTDLIRRLAPCGTEPDLHDGQSYISIVAFAFERVRLLGIPFPAHTNFPEINLRYYVRREVAGELRRGVVFVREIVPRRAVAILANRLYNENYLTRPMRITNKIAGPELAQGDTLDYAWRTNLSLPNREGRGEGSAKHLARHTSNRVAAQLASPLALPAAGSLEEFIVEHYWGYTHGRHGGTNEYQVAHVPWRIATANNITWHCDIPTNYPGPFAEYLTAPPTSAIIAEGSRIQVFPGTHCAN